MDIDKIKNFNEELVDELYKEINKFINIPNDNMVEQLILQDKLVNLLLIIKNENEK